MTHKITSINDMCQCELVSKCHFMLPLSNQVQVLRCIAYGPIKLFHRETGNILRFCEDCAVHNMHDYSPIAPQEE